MLIYSSYHDEFFEVDGKASELIRDREDLREFIEWLLGFEIEDIHISLAGRIDVVFIADVWVNIGYDIVRFLLIDTPIKLSERQWERLLEHIDSKYVRFWGIKVRSTRDFDEVFKILNNKVKRLGEELTFITSLSRYEFLHTINELIVEPWKVLLVLEEDEDMHIYLMPRILLGTLRRELIKRKIPFSYIRRRHRYY